MQDKSDSDIADISCTMPAGCGGVSVDDVVTGRAPEREREGTAPQPRGAFAGVGVDEAMAPPGARRKTIYIMAWPVSAELAYRWVHVVGPGASHWAKHTRGLVARRVCELGVSARTPQRLAEELSGSFVTALCPPARPGRAWTLEATPRGSAVHDGGGQGRRAQLQGSVGRHRRDEQPLRQAGR